MSTPRTALVITSIAAPNAVLRSFAEGCRTHGMDFLVIGDVPSPKDFALDGCDFRSLEQQRAMPFGLAGILPERHYGRKNLGYLQAIRDGAEVILESDDDNFPRAEFWLPRQRTIQAEPFEEAGWVNMYRCFSTANIWPRGFPLERVLEPVPVPKAADTRLCPIQQGLADDNPDVDAIYRLTSPLPLTFDRRAVQVSLGRRSWCAFNSQNTTWFHEAFPLLYLPSHCSFRMTDIWRSYVAVRICWENGWDVLFHNATVWQERNAHNLMRDFADEVIGYVNNAAICERLAALTLKPGPEHILDNMMRCYAEFIAMGLVDARERPLLEAWAADIQGI